MCLEFIILIIKIEREILNNWQFESKDWMNTLTNEPITHPLRKTLIIEWEQVNLGNLLNCHSPIKQLIIIKTDAIQTNNFTYVNPDQKLNLNIESILICPYILFLNKNNQTRIIPFAI
jgi:hypothetical protein